MPEEREPTTSNGGFKLKYAPHFGQFKEIAGPDYVDQLRFAAEQGFRAWEDNIIRERSVAEQERIAAAMAKLGMEMGVFLGFVRNVRPELLLTSGDRAARDHFLKVVSKSVEVARRVNAKWMTIIPSRRDTTLREEYQIANVVDGLKRAADIVEPHGLVMAVEPVNSRIDFPDVFPDRIPTAYLICRAVDRPSCRLLFDVYHHQIMDGNIIRDLGRAWDQVDYVQVADHPGRNEPTTGEINYVNVLQFLVKRGYKGIVGMEHGVSGQGAEGIRKMIEAYRHCDSLLG